MNDERLKNPAVGSSTVPDYQPSLKETTLFFQTIQNKLHFACTGHTAAKLIHQRADATIELS